MSNLTRDIKTFCRNRVVNDLVMCSFLWWRFIQVHHVFSLMRFKPEKCFGEILHFAKPDPFRTTRTRRRPVFLPRGGKNDRMSSTAPRRNYSRRMRMWSIVKRVKCFHVINFSTAPSSSPSSLLSLTPFRRRPRAHRWRRRRRRRWWWWLRACVVDVRSISGNGGTRPNRNAERDVFGQILQFLWRIVGFRVTVVGGPLAPGVLLSSMRLAVYLPSLFCVQRLFCVFMCGVVSDVVYFRGLGKVYVYRFRLPILFVQILWMLWCLCSVFSARGRTSYKRLYKTFNVSSDVDVRILFRLSLEDGRTHLFLSPE